MAAIVPSSDSSPCSHRSTLLESVEKKVGSTSKFHEDEVMASPSTVSQEKHELNDVEASVTQEDEDDESFIDGSDDANTTPQGNADDGITDEEEDNWHGSPWSQDEVRTEFRCSYWIYSSILDNNYNSDVPPFPL
jgi:hypothetical protein